MMNLRSKVAGVIGVGVLVLSAGCAGTAPLAPKAVSLNQDGVAAMEAGDMLTAEARFGLALEYHPKFVDARVNLGLLEMERGNFELARIQLERAVKINRNLAQPHHGLGVLAEREGRPQEAIEHYEDALAVDPGFAPSRANIARIYFESGRLDEAREQFLRLIQADPTCPAGWAGLADTLFRLGRTKQAEKVIREARAHVADAPVLKLYEARIELLHGRPGRARALLVGLTKGKRHELERDAWSWIALSYLMQGDTSKAIKGAEQALRIDRDAALPTYVLAMALDRRRDPDARSWLDRASQMAPGNSVLTVARGRNPKNSR